MRLVTQMRLQVSRASRRGSPSTPSVAATVDGTSAGSRTSASVTSQHAVVEIGRQLVGHGECESRLARATGARERQQATSSRRSSPWRPRARAHARLAASRVPGGSSATQAVARAGATGSWRRIARSSSLQRRARLDPEIVEERAAGRLIGVERLGLPPGPIEGEHQQLAKALAVRVLCDARLELPDQSQRGARTGARHRSALDHGCPAFLETSAFGAANAGWPMSASAGPRHSASASRSVSTLLRPLLGIGVC